jgi:antirestriction protein ArdC
MLDKRETAEDGTERKRRIPLLRHYNVFNVEQCDDVKLPPRFTMPEEREPLAVSEAVREILDGYADGPEVRHTPSERAYYSPALDAITLPALEQWSSEAGYAGTLFHELTHSTGHPSRLDRFPRNGEPQHFGSDRYAREELVAEMGAAILAATRGIACDFEQSAAYVASWLRALNDDPSLVITAAQQAQRATDRILGTTFERSESETEQAA